MISEKISRIDSEFSDIAEAVRENYMTMNYQLFDKESIEKFNGFVDINNKTVQYNLNVKSLIQPCKPNTIYSVKKINGGSDDRFNIGTFTEIPFAGKIATNVVGDNSANHLEITTGNQDEYLMVLYFKTSESKYTEQEIIDSIIIYEGKYDAEKNDTSFRKYKPYQMPKAITDMANDIKDTLYKFLPTKKVIDGVCENAVNLPIVQFSTDGNSNQKTTKGTNLCDLNVSQVNNVTYNLDGTIKINRSGGFLLNFKDYNFKANTTYYMKWELVSGKTSEDIDNIIMTPSASRYAPKDTFTAFSYSEDTIKNGFLINESATFTNAVIRIWFSESQSDFEEYTGRSIIT